MESQKIELERVKTPYILALVFIVAILVRLTYFFYVNYAFDDAYIVWRIARNFSIGNGLLFNINEYAQTSTSAIYALLSGSLWYVFGETASLIIRLLGIAADSAAAAGITALVLAVKSTSKASAILSGLLYAVFPTAVLVAGAGLETGIYCLLLVSAFYAFSIERHYLALFIGAGAAIIRPDGLLCLGVLITCKAYFLARNKALFSKSARVFVLPIVLYVFYILMIWAYYGTIIPQSITAKSAYAINHWEVWSGFINKFFYGGPRTLLGGIFLVGIWVTLRGGYQSLYPFFAWGGGYAIAFSTIGFWWAWYYPPFILVYCAALALGSISIIKLLTGRLHGRTQGFMVFAFSALLLVQFMLKITERGGYFGGAEEQYHEQRKEIAIYLNKRLDKYDVVTLEPLGIFGYYSNNIIADYPGLASRKASNALATLGRKIGGNPGDAEAMSVLVDHVHPAAVILRESEYKASLKSAWISGYLLDKVFTVDSETTKKYADFQSMYILTKSTK